MPRCGHVPVTTPLRSGTVPWDRLTTDERSELAGLLRASANPPCGACGHVNYGTTFLSDDQRRLALQLLRRIFGRDANG